MTGKITLPPFSLKILSHYLQPGRPSTQTELWYLWCLATFHHYAISVYPLQILHYFAEEKNSKQLLWIFLTWFMSKEQWNEICNEQLQQFHQPDIRTIFIVTRFYQQTNSGPVPFPICCTWRSKHGQLTTSDRTSLFNCLCDWNSRVIHTPGQIRTPKTTRLRYLNPLLRMPIVQHPPEIPAESPSLPEDPTPMEIADDPDPVHADNPGPVPDDPDPDEPNYSDPEFSQYPEDYEPINWDGCGLFWDTPYSREYYRYHNTG